MNEIKTNKEAPTDGLGVATIALITPYHIIYIRNDRQYSVLLILPLKENGLLNIPLLEGVSDVDDDSCLENSKVGAAVAVIIGASCIVISE